MTVGIADWGPLVVATDVDEAIIAQFNIWLPTYLNQLSTERALGYVLPIPKTVTNALESDEWLDNQLPAVIVTTASTAKTVGGPNNFYQATWNVTVSCIVRGTNGRATRRTAALYEGAIRRCFLNKCRGNDTPLNDPGWKGTEVAPIREAEPIQSRFLAAGIGKYNVATDQAAQGFGGPDVPDADSYVPLATVTDVVIDVESEE